MNNLKKKVEGKMNKKSATPPILILTAVLLCLLSTTTAADDSSLPKGAQPIVTSVEGNITYYAKVGDTLKKGEPLFFVKTNDWPIGKIKQIKEDIVYFKKTYERNRKLAKTNAVAIQSLDDSWHNYHDALNQLEIAKQQCENGFYSAPFDCKVVRCEVPTSSGIGDGNPAMYIQEIPEDTKK